MYDGLMGKKKNEVSPLAVGLLHVLPSWILIGSIAVVVTNLYFQNNQKVLGVETSYNGLIKTVTREERVIQLESELKRNAAGTVNDQLEVLNK